MITDIVFGSLICIASWFSGMLIGEIGFNMIRGKNEVEKI